MKTVLGVAIGIGIVAFGACGCSRRDPPDYTPQFRATTPTNRSVVNSWEANKEPMYTQPGVYSGKPYVLPPVPSERGFEPYDPLATRVYNALTLDQTLNTKYVSVAAKGSIARLTGTIPSIGQRTQAAADAKAVTGVRAVQDYLKVVVPTSQDPSD